ncbi:MAG: DUF5063 domain-containing protein [Muribaculaceae bacterium]|nr:DUF5063 domain-containing protein [Muribaculaceae bacterium]
MENDKLSPTSLAFIVMANEYCEIIENCAELGREGFVESMLKLLPRIYITISDIEPSLEYFDAFISQSLDEPTYDMVRGNISALMGEEDVYLEVFLEDMKYSDTPIATSISENLADLYQEFYNVVSSLRDLNTDEQRQILGMCKENFTEYWGQTLCNVFRALHSVSVAYRDEFES